ncbi:hypothetical protein, Excinuclease ABC, C subunit domain [Bradyrhizobium sp. ORS 375]|nr:hypothetical protein, Excinuclease ABC, C subunit domain [Bradyrhizobium sp. ORS 375]
MSVEAAWTVYILASGHYGTLYIGVTNDVRKRLEDHRAGRGSKFVSRYKVFRLVHVERFASRWRRSPARSSSRIGIAIGRSS